MNHSSRPPLPPPCDAKTATGRMAGNKKPLPEGIELKKMNGLDYMQNSINFAP